MLFCSTLAILYLIPTLVQHALLRVMPGLTAHVLLGDLLGCALLWRIGQTRVAAGIYVLMSGVEFGLVRMHVASLGQMVWITNLAPALAIAWVLQDAVTAVVELE